MGNEICRSAALFYQENGCAYFFCCRFDEGDVGPCYLRCCRGTTYCQASAGCKAGRQVGKVLYYALDNAHGQIL